MTRRFRTLLTVAAGSLALTGAALAGSYPNSSSVSVPDAGGNVGSAPASDIVVSGESAVTSVTVDLFGVEHARPDDLDILLVGPVGQEVVLMSDAGADNSVGALDVTFDDNASGPPSDEGVLASGVFQP